MIIIGWIAAIFLLGGYRQQVFGAGLDEYKRVVNASLLTAAAVGIGCFLLQFELSRGFFVLAFAIGIPVLVLGRLAAAPQRPARPHAWARCSTASSSPAPRATSTRSPPCWAARSGSATT